MLNKMIQIALLLAIISVSPATAEEVTPINLPILSGVGGNFTALNSDGKTIEFKQYQGQVVLLAFGYTNCADICPFTLGYLKGLYNKLSDKEKKSVTVLFATIDPNYDTPEHLKGFVEYFNKDFVGITGTQAQMDHVVSLFKATYSKLSDAKVPTKDIRRVTQKKTDEKTEDKAKLFTHTVTIYLIDKQGKTRNLEYTGTDKDKFVKKIQSLIKENS